MINWDLILDTIESEKCVLILGPEIRKNATGKLINSEFYDSLKVQENPYILKFYKNDELFLFPDGMSKTMFYYDVKKSLHNSSVSNLYHKISRLPFHLFLSANNDLFLSDAFDSNNFSYNFNFYNKNQVAVDVKTPSKHKPLIYNLMGCIDHEESIILDYDDLLEFLFSVLGTKPLPLELKNSLQDASNFIFLGFSFEMKFFQIILKLLNFNMKRKIKFAFNKEHAESVKTFYTDQFKINFVDGQLENFVDGLYTKFEEKGSLRNPVNKTDTLRGKIEELISQNQLSKALDELKSFFEKHNENEHNTIIILLSRLRALDDKINTGVIEYKEIELERNKLRAAILASINKIEEN